MEVMHLNKGRLDNKVWSHCETFSDPYFVHSCSTFNRGTLTIRVYTSSIRAMNVAPFKMSRASLLSQKESFKSM